MITNTVEFLETAKRLKIYAEDVDRYTKLAYNDQQYIQHVSHAVDELVKLARKYESFVVEDGATLQQRMKNQRQLINSLSDAANVEYRITSFFEQSEIVLPYLNTADRTSFTCNYQDMQYKIKTSHISSIIVITFKSAKTLHLAEFTPEEFLAAGGLDVFQAKFQAEEFQFQLDMDRDRSLSLQFQEEAENLQSITSFESDAQEDVICEEVEKVINSHKNGLLSVVLTGDYQVFVDSDSTIENNGMGLLSFQDVGIEKMINYHQDNENLVLQTACHHDADIHVSIIKQIWTTDDYSYPKEKLWDINDVIRSKETDHEQTDFLPWEQWFTLTDDELEKELNKYPDSTSLKNAAKSFIQSKDKNLKRKSMIIERIITHIRNDKALNQLGA